MEMYSSWSNFDHMTVMEDPFGLAIPPLDFCSSGEGDELLDWQYGDLAMQNLTLPPPLPSVSTDRDQQVPFLLQDVVEDDSDGYGSVWNDIEGMKSFLGIEEGEEKQQPLVNAGEGHESVEKSISKNKGRRSRSEERGNASCCGNKLTKKALSQYFYMPITRAAKELNMGLTLLKKCCRQLGIRRWPHRKLMSLKTLMKNVQEGSESEEKKREWVGRLEEERRLIEEMPDMQMHDKTKRLRQSCFKENYKKRRRINVDLDSSNDNVVSNYNEEEEEEEMRCLLFCDSLSPITDIFASST